MDKEGFKKLFSKENKKFKADIFMIFAIGVVLLVFGNSFMGGNKKADAGIKKTVPETSADNFGNTEEESLEKRLEIILSKVEGAGNVDVMITLTNGGEITVAEDLKQEKSITEETVTNGDKRSIDSDNHESKTVLLENSNGSTEPLVLKENKPKVEGIVIVSQGGDDIVVKDALSRAAQALLNVPAHKVEVLKMKNSKWI